MDRRSNLSVITTFSLLHHLFVLERMMMNEMSSPLLQISL